MASTGDDGAPVGDDAAGVAAYLDNGDAGSFSESKQDAAQVENGIAQMQQGRDPDQDFVPAGGGDGSDENDEPPPLGRGQGPNEGDLRAHIARAKACIELQGKGRKRKRASDSCSWVWGIFLVYQIKEPRTETLEELRSLDREEYDKIVKYEAKSKPQVVCRACFDIPSKPLGVYIL